MEDLEDGDNGKTHAQAQDAAAVGHEPDDGNPLMLGFNQWVSQSHFGKWEVSSMETRTDNPIP